MISLVAALLLATGAHRNLFAYVDPPASPPAPARVVRTHATLVPPAVIATPPTPTQPPAAPHFDWLYIGRFGMDTDPIAVFTRDGEVRTLRRGQTLDGFTLGTISIESVEVVAGAGAQTIRLHDRERPLPH